jgi:hypothetical protein
MTDHFFKDFHTAPHLLEGPLGVYVDDVAALLQDARSRWPNCQTGGQRVAEVQ